MYVHILPLVILLYSEVLIAPIFLLLTLWNCKGQIRDRFLWHYVHIKCHRNQ